MSAQDDTRIVRELFAAVGRGDKQGLLASVAEDIEWIIPGEDWPLAGTYRGHAGLADLLETASKEMETSTEPREYLAQGDRVLVIGFAKGKVKVTSRTFEDNWVFAITVDFPRMLGSSIFRWVASAPPRTLLRWSRCSSRIAGSS